MLLALVITSTGDIHDLYRKTEKAIFGLTLQKLVNLLSLGTASANSEQLLLILERVNTEKEAVPVFHFEGTFVLSLGCIRQFESYTHKGIQVIPYDSLVELL